MKKFILFVFLMQTGILFAQRYDKNYDFYANNDDGKEIYYNITSSVEPYTVEVTYQYNSSGFPNIVSSYKGDVNIPESITYNGIRYSVTAIGDNAFYQCKDLLSVNIPNSVLSIKSGAFYYCTSLADITIPDRVKSIGSYAFNYCNQIKKLTIPESVTSIDREAFSGCPITDLNFNAINCTGVTSSTIFSGTKLENVHIGDKVEVIPSYIFSRCSALSEISLPESVKVIGDGAFKECISLKSLYISESVETIGNNSFAGCIALTEISMPESLTAIGHNAFLGSGLVSVDLPGSLNTIGSYTFKDCVGLTAVTIPASVTNIGSDAFSGCTELTTVNFNASDCSSMNGNSSYYVFKNCNKLSTLNIGDNVKNIPNYAFYNCSGLEGNLLLPNSVENIGNSAFYNCAGLKSVSIGESVKSIGSEAFGRCKGLVRINLSADNLSTAGVTDSPVFNGCTNISIIDIAENVANIPQYTFKGCENVTQVYSRSLNPAVLQGITSFDSYNYFATLYVPGGSKERYQGANYWKRFSDIVETDFSGIEDSINDNSDVSVYISGGSLNIKGAADNTPIQIYNFSGKLLYKTTTEKISGLNIKNGTYIVSIGKFSVKVVK